MRNRARPKTWICWSVPISRTPGHAALAEFGAPLDGVTPEDFMVPGSFFRMGRPPLMVDILPAIQGVDFESAWERRTEIEIDTESGLRVSVISRRDLIAAKLAA